LAISVPTAKFGYPEVRRGLVAAMVLPHLLRHIGERAARHLLLTGELIDAEEAVRIGLINQVVSPTSLLDDALTWAKSCAEGGPLALATTKDLLKRFRNRPSRLKKGPKRVRPPRLGVRVSRRSGCVL